MQGATVASKLVVINQVSEWVIVVNVMWAVFQPYHGKNKLHFDE